MFAWWCNIYCNSFGLVKFCLLGKVMQVFKASALWADAFYKSKCPYVSLCVCVSVCVFTLEVPFLREQFSENIATKD